MNYYPDFWHIIRITPKNKEPFYKILATWAGSYSSGSSWKLSSGGNEFIDKEDEFECPQASGSVYYINKKSEGIHWSWQYLKDKFESLSCEECKIEFVSAHDLHLL